MNICIDVWMLVNAASTYIFTSSKATRAPSHQLVKPGRHNEDFGCFCQGVSVRMKKKKGWENGRTLKKSFSLSISHSSGVCGHCPPVQGPSVGSMVQTVAVIGAGPSGLASIKSCLDEGLEPTCFESGPDIGGLWRFKEEPEPGRANIYQSVIINTSKEMMAFSDFPPPAHFPNNMHHSEVLLYLRLYARSFGLLQHIRFQTTVVGVRQTPDFAATGRWEVETEHCDGRRECHVFDAVMVCTGHYTTPHLPLSDFPGIESFEGKYFHTWEYRNPEGLQGKRVVVVGMGNSGGDIAVDISRVAEKVYLSTRSGAWVLSRVGLGGLPQDLFGNSRMDALKMKLFPSRVNQMMEKELNRAFDHQLYGIRPKHTYVSQVPVVNDDLPARIISGRVQIKPNLKRFTASDAIFDDGSVIHEVDVVVFATGYGSSFPFLPPDLQSKCSPGPQHRLYRHVLALGLAPPTLVVIGLIDGLGPVNLVAELQARWATRVFKGLIRLPSQEAMMKDIERESATRRKRFPLSAVSPMLRRTSSRWTSSHTETPWPWRQGFDPTSCDSS
ncbi:flavin-containing monooxygenase 5-like isoform X2 [Vanacampus margaritifer]